VGTLGGPGNPYAPRNSTDPRRKAPRIVSGPRRKDPRSHNGPRIPHDPRIFLPGPTTVLGRLLVAQSNQAALVHSHDIPRHHPFLISVRVVVESA
jgi:hypothetical protein